MNDDQIRQFYDSNLNLTLAQLSQLTGKTIQQLKTILLK